MPANELKISLKQFHQNSPDKISGSLVLPVFQNETDNVPATDGTLTAINNWFSGELLKAAEEEKFKGEKGKILRFRPGNGHSIRRVILVGLGEKKGANTRRVLQVFPGALRQSGAVENHTTLNFFLPTVQADDPIQKLDWAQMIPDLVYQSLYRSAEAQKQDQDLEELVILTDTEVSASMEREVEIGNRMGLARSLSMDLVNMPSNTKTTSVLAERAMLLNGSYGLSVSVIDDVEWIKKEMPAFFEVAKGSLTTDPPRFIQFHYKPEGEIKKRIALIGKTVIFDSGGYQVKTGDYMVTMKADMTGGAQVLATMEAISSLKIQGLEVFGYMAATPNKIDSGAMIPDSIIDSTCGKKIEIRNTDAEGRLTLIDVVAKALEKDPEMILTIATLTGAAKRSVGSNIALMSNNNSFLERFRGICDSVGDPAQNLEVMEEDYEDIKSKLDGADLSNVNKSRVRGSQTAAAFVMTPTPAGIPHIHLDIAGIDMSDDDKSTGVGQKSLIRFVLDLSRE